MFLQIMANLSPKGETFKHFDVLNDVFRSRNFWKVKSSDGQGERLRERFKSHKYMKNKIYIKKNNNLSPIHPTPTRATRCAHARIEPG
jgi:hypothetical protein